MKKYMVNVANPRGKANTLLSSRKINEGKQTNTDKG
jgi:hypothetical protein